VSHKMMEVDRPIPAIDYPFRIGDAARARGLLVVGVNSSKNPDGSYDYPIEEHSRVPC